MYNITYYNLIVQLKREIYNILYEKNYIVIHLYK